MIVVGDVHGELHQFIGKLERSNIKRSNIYQVGDWGLGFMDEETDIHNLNVIDKIMQVRECNLTIIRGNHDNPDFWKRGLEFENIQLMDDYTINIDDADDKVTLSIGGGISIDRAYRVKGESYWENEAVVFDEAALRLLLDQIQKMGKKIDRVITHVAPVIAPPLDTLKNEMVEGFIENEKYVTGWKDRDLRADIIAEREALNKAWDIIKEVQGPVEEWFYGHYHKNMYHEHQGTKFRCCGILECWSTIDEMFL